MPRLSEMPDFLPLGKPGSPERLACALGTFTDREANLDYVRFLKREAARSYIAKAQANPSAERPLVRNGVKRGA